MLNILHILNSQKGAMFGMDARLALMIFTVLTGTLSYFAYGKLQTVRQVALVKELTDIDYALRSYQTDMGTFIPFTVQKPTDTTKKRNDMSILWSLDKVKTNYSHLWNGPYVDFSKEDHQLYGSYGLTYMTDEHTPCRASTKCYTFIEVTDVPENVWNTVNKHFDENNGRQPEGLTDAHLIGKLRAEKLNNPRKLWFKSVER